MRYELIKIQDAQIAPPCKTSWDSMCGDDRVRYCAECNNDVYNFAAMTAPEIQELLASRQGGSLCARIYRRGDGTLLTRSCPRGIRAVAHKVSKLAAAILAAVMSLTPASGHAGHKPRQRPPSARRENHNSGLALNVIDHLGSTVPGVKITLVHKSVRKKRRGVSDASGQLHFTDLRAADYLLTAQAQGFRPASAELALNEGKVLELLVRLPAQAVAAEVVVTGETPIVIGLMAIRTISESGHSPVSGRGGPPQPG
jgi:hypothetical protein